MGVIRTFLPPTRPGLRSGTGRESTTMRITTTLLIVGAMVALAACSGTSDRPGTGSTTTTADPAPTTTLDPEAGIDWGDPSRVVDLGDGFTVAACQGDAPLLCVDLNGAPAGVVEAQSYPIASLPLFDPTADDHANLTALAEDFVETFRKDRAEGCGEDYLINPVAVKPIVLAGRDGILFGFEGRLRSGDLSELNLHYAIVDDDAVVSIVANAYDEGGCPGPDDLGGFDTTTLTDFWPHLDALLRSTPLPDSI